jgi:tRNA A-37 threonylcarbamoyl transferase component Bud32
VAVAHVERIGSYVVVDEIGHGGFATVHRARQPRLHREVALKRVLLDPPDVAHARRFVQAARAATALDHRNAVAVLDCFEHAGTPYVVMEHVAGGSLRPLVRTLTPAQVVGVLEQILAALEHAERQLVVHGDLKPENVLVARDGTVKVGDFALAAAWRALDDAPATGSPGYMAPEQGLGRAADARTDLYAVGVMAFEMLARELPFGSAAARTTVLARHVEEPVPPLGPQVDPELADWVDWMLAKEPRDRPPGAAAAWRALEDVALDAAGPHWRFAAPLAAVGPPRAPRPARRRSSRHALVALIAIVLAAVVLALALLARDGDDRRPERAATAPTAAGTEEFERASTATTERMLGRVIAANRKVERGLRDLAAGTSPDSVLTAVEQARSLTRRARRMPALSSVSAQLDAEERYLAAIAAALADPSSENAAAATRAADRLRNLLARVDDVARGGAASVGGLGALADWTVVRLAGPATTPATSPPGPSGAGGAARIGAVDTPTPTATVAPTPATGDPVPPAESGSPESSVSPDGG